MNHVEPKILERIRKCLALGESPNEHEAMQAIMTAQRLALKHGLDLESIKTSDEPRKVVREELDKQKRGHIYPRYKRVIATILGQNFRVQPLYNTIRKLTQYWVIGLPDDVAIYRQVYGYTIAAYELLLPLAIEDHYREYRLDYRDAATTKALQNDYLDGFCTGLNDRFRQNIEEFALMVVKPIELQQELERIKPRTVKHTCTVAGCQTMKSRGNHDAKQLKLHTELEE